MWSIFNSPKVKQSLKGSPQYNYVLGRRFDPGAEAEVFQPADANPVFLFRGNGRLAGALAVLAPPQVWVAGAIGTAGLGGIQAGQIVGQNLIDPSQLENPSTE